LFMQKVVPSEETNELGIDGLKSPNFKVQRSMSLQPGGFSSPIS
jgi:hypothetical protein